jgi:hypothetical protein
MVAAQGMGTARAGCSALVRHQEAMDKSRVTVIQFEIGGLTV